MPDINKDLVSRLRERAELNLAWDKWEIGNQPVPPPLLHAETAAFLKEAADAIEGLQTALASADRHRAAEVAKLLEALKPFADHLNEMRFDLNNKGEELPDDQAVGWIYLTNGDFRRARTALEGK
jgi:hypothetical protein